MSTLIAAFGDPWTPDSEGLVATNGEAHRRVLNAVNAEAK